MHSLVLTRLETNNHLNLTYLGVTVLANQQLSHPKTQVKSASA